jgi:hypothetical protein
MMPNRGGKRPGAGAPKGNINHLKDGHRSKLMRAIAAAVADAEKRRELVQFLETQKISQAGL